MIFVIKLHKMKTSPRECLQHTLRMRIINTYKEAKLFVLFAYSKAGRYKDAEFETAFGSCRVCQKPLIFTYLKDVETGQLLRKVMCVSFSFDSKTGKGDIARDNEGATFIC